MVRRMYSLVLLGGKRKNAFKFSLYTLASCEDLNHLIYITNILYHIICTWFTNLLSFSQQLSMIISKCQISQSDILLGSYKKDLFFLWYFLTVSFVAIYYVRRTIEKYISFFLLFWSRKE